MNQNNVKQKRSKFQKSPNADHKVFDKSKPKKSFDKAKPENSKIIFDDEGNQQKPTKKKNAKRSTQSFNQTDDVASRWYEEVSTCDFFSSFPSLNSLF